MDNKTAPKIMNTYPKVSIYIASSIDGYIARKDGNLDWLHYGHTGDEDYGFKKFTSTIDAVVMGRNTYEVVAGFDLWAYKDKRVIVLSNTLSKELEKNKLKDFCKKCLLNAPSNRVYLQKHFHNTFLCIM